MKLLMASPLEIFYFDTSSKTKQVIENNRLNYYGITWDSNGFIYLGHTNLQRSELGPKNDSVNHEKGYISNLLSKQTSDLILAAPHQILYSNLNNNYELLVCNTGRNCITVFDEKLYSRHLWPNISKKWDMRNGKKVGFHINSVYAVNGMLYVLCHGWSTNSFFYTYDYSKDLWSLPKELPKTQWAHNIWIDEEGEIIVCNTRHGSLSTSRGEILWFCGNNNSLTRGMAANKDYIFIGKTPFIHDRITRVGNSKDGGVWILDRQTYKELEYISIPDSGGITEIRLLDEVDFCHNGIVLSSRRLEEYIRKQ